MQARAVSGVVRILAGDGTYIAAQTARRISRNAGPVSADLFAIGKSQIYTALTDRAAAGRGVRLLVNPHVDNNIFMQPLLGDLQDLGARVTLYGSRQTAIAPARLWSHSKIYYFAGGGTQQPSALVSTMAVGRNPHHSELAIELTGDAAYSVRALNVTGRSGRTAWIRSAADQAAAAGVLVNDPIADVWLLSQTLHTMIDGAGKRLTIAMKGLDDLDMTQRIVRAHERGVKVQVNVRDLAVADAALLERAGVPTLVLADAPHTMHFNALFADGQAYIGSAFGWAPMNGGNAGNISRDIGVLLDGAAARNARRHVNQMLRPGGGIDIAAARARQLLTTTAEGL